MEIFADMVFVTGRRNERAPGREHDFTEGTTTMPVKPLPAQDLLCQLLDYDAETGTLTWKPRDVSMFKPSKTRSAKHVAGIWNSRYAGTPALTAIERDGHLKGTVDGVYYKAHRIIWKMVHGVDPVEVDHINGNASDNRLINLRSVTGAENSRNMQRYSSNSTGDVGVYRKGKFWMARIGGKENLLYLGTFLTKQEAVAARQAAEVMLGYHPNHGRSAQPSRIN